MIDRAVRYIEQNRLNVFALAAMRDGVLEAKRLLPANEMNNVYSVSKTVTATAIGILAARGLITTKDRAVRWLGELLPDDCDPKWQTVTVGNLLSHTWGQFRGDLFENDRHGIGGDWLNYVLSQRLPLQVGEDMRYSNASYYLLSVIVERITGRTLADFVREELANPLDWRGYAAGSCPEGHTLGATEMFLSVTDMAKLGALWLGRGVFEGRRYFADDWAERASRPHATDGRRLYGYSVWRDAPDSAVYYADGAHGQLIAVCPRDRTVLAVQSFDRFDMQAFVNATVETAP